MNILWIPNFLPFPADNGGKVVISNRMKQVSKKHKIHLIVEAENVSKEVKNEIAQICNSCTFVKPINRGKVFLMKYFFFSCLNVGRYANKEMVSAIKKCINAEKIDLINIDLPMVFVNLYPILKDLNGIPVVINQHNIEYLNVRSKLTVKGLNPAIKVYAVIEAAHLYRWEKRLYAHKEVKALSFVSDIDIKRFKKAFSVGEKELFLSPIGTNIPSQNVQKAISDERKIIIFPAAFDYGPNVHGAKWFVQEVMPIIREKVPNAVLYLVGKNPKDEIKNLQCKDILVTGTVDSILPYMASADLFVVPIFFGGGVKTKLIEMGCWKKPIISTPQGATGTLYQKNVDLLIEEESKKFAAACVMALNNPGEYSEMTNNMFDKTVSNYIWDNIGEKYCDFLERTVKR